jgi:hypothetical protein
MKLRDRTIVMVIGAVCVGFTLDAKVVGYVDTVDLGALPSSTTSMQLFNSFLNIPYASGQYSNTPQNSGYSYTGTGPVIGGTVTGSAGAPATFIYEFSSNSQILISGEVDGPSVNFGNASLYS